MNDARPMIVAAKWVAPMDRRVLGNGALIIESGIIREVGPFTSIRQSHPRAEVIDLPKSILLPGLVNAHVHLELSTCECGPPPRSFADWILSLRERMKIDPANAQAALISAVHKGIAQSLDSGVTCVGDITSHIEISREALRRSPLRAVSYGEALGLGKLRPRFEASLSRAVHANHEHNPDRIRIGLSPHAPYTVDLAGYRQALDLAMGSQLPIATHLAENCEEEQFLRDHAGPFREIWDKLGLWQDDVVTFNGSPIAFAKSIGLLDYPTLLAHVNYCTDAELEMLATGNASVVYCPRTHRYFGHQPHRFREMLARGINVAVGTDSCASSPDLNLVDDLRLIRQIAPEMDAFEIWKLATINAARALTMESTVGSLSVGKLADVVAFDVDSDHPLIELLEAPRLARLVWVGGKAASLNQNRT